MSPAHALSTPQLRAALGRFATGVTLVTCTAADGRFVGLTANSFNTLSLQPPLVLWSLRDVSPSMVHFQAASHFAINVLAIDQVALSRRFASNTADKFGAGDWQLGPGGAPVLAGCAAVFECEARSNQVAGDHVLFIGRVQHVAHSTLAPLLYQGGHYRSLGEKLG